MTAVEHGRSRAAADRLAEVAGPDLYRRNAFRVTGLATDAPSRQVRQQRRRVLDAFELGVGAAINDSRLPLPEPPAAYDARAAFDLLERADCRLVDELFWWWGDPGACGCARDVHSLHDLAVEAHAKALDLERAGAALGRAERLDLWVNAADAWRDALDHQGFWEHVRHRVDALSDRRLDESTVDGLRVALPRALLAPQTALARKFEASADLARLLDVWDFPLDVIEDVRAAAAAAVYERIEALLKDIDVLRDGGNATAAARRAMDELPAAAALLDTLVPYERFRRSARKRNEIAVIMNNCALDMTDANVEPNQSLKLELLEHAVELIVDQKDRDIIQENLDDHPAVSPSRAAQAPLWEQVTSMVEAGRLDEADRLLIWMWFVTTDPGLRSRIEAMRQKLVIRRAPAPRHPRVPRAAHIWPMNAALCLCLITVLLLVTGLWQIPVGLTAAMTMVLTPIPLTVTYTRRYRDWVSPFVGWAALLSACAAIVQMGQFGWAAVLWCLGALVVALPGATLIARSLAGRWDNR